MFKKDFKNIIISFSKDKYLLVLLPFFFIGVFLRFYRLEEFAMFLADQGRDAIIIKRILTFEHWPAIGASTSVGQVYLGPFYYYFIAPWLLIFNYNPVGLAFGVAFFSSLFIIINYFIVKDLFNEKIALISSFFIAFSSVLIDFSRFSWNPNLLPLFSLLTIYFLIKSLKTQKKIFYFLFGSFLSFSIQLHYLALFLIPPTIIISIIRLIELKKKELRKQLILNQFFSLLSFFFFSLPLLIFDFRHDFLNSKNFLTLFKGSGSIISNKITELVITFEALNRYIFNFEMNRFFLIAILILFFISGIFLLFKKDNIRFFIIFFLFSLGGISLYSGPKHAHYLGIVFPVYFIVLSFFLTINKSKVFAYFLIPIFLLSYLFLNSKNYYFLKNKGNNQIEHARKVAQFLDRVINTEKFNFAVQPDGWQEDSYLYFLELKGKRPQDRRKLEIGDVMFVVCGQPCDLYRTKSWNVTMFGQFKIDKEWLVDNVKIYKLVHKN